MSYLSVAIERNRFLNRHLSVHADGDASKLTRPFKCAYSELRSIDGIDDFANLVGQILPKLGQSVATLGIVLPATPFVAMGAVGAVTDAHEQLTKTYPDVVLEIARNEDAVFDQLQLEGKSPEEIAGVRSNLRHAIDYLRTNGSDELRYRIDQYERSNASRSAAQLDRNASIFGAIGMSGMTAGMFPLMGQAIAGIVENSADQFTAHGAALAQNAAAAGSALGTAASSIFFVSQLAMAAKGASDSRSGIAKNAALKEDSKSIARLAKDPEFADATLSQANEISQDLLAAKRYYNKHHSISAGSLLAAGQSLMAVGSATTLTGVGAGVGLVCTALGAPATIAGAAQQTIYRKVEDGALGADASDSAQMQKLDPMPVLEQHGIGKAVHAAADRIVQSQDDVVRSKLDSLIQHVLDKEIKSGKKLTPYLRQQEVESMAGNGRKGSFTGTTLLKSDIARLKPMLMTYYADGVLDGNAMAVLRRLNDVAANRFVDKKLTLTDKHGAGVLKKTVREVVKDRTIDPVDKGAMLLAPNQRRKEVDVRQMLEATHQSHRVDDILTKHMTKALTSQIKTDSKFLRHDGVNALSSMSVTANRRSK